MILTLEEYKIPRALMSRIVEVVGDACFYHDEDGESSNNDDVIAVDKRLREEIERQQSEAIR